MTSEKRKKNVLLIDEIGARVLPRSQYVNKAIIPSKTFIGLISLVTAYVSENKLLTTCPRHAIYVSISVQFPGIITRTTSPVNTKYPH